MENIGVIGLGKLGAPLVAVLASSGFNVYGYDIDQGLVDLLSVGQNSVIEPDLTELMHEHKKKHKGM